MLEKRMGKAGAAAGISVTIDQYGCRANPSKEEATAITFEAGEA
jgi:hypothetical protein